MLAPELIAKIRHIEIHTRRLLSGTHVGDYSTAQKGSGFEFDQLREYQEGDDVRFIDWNSSVRMNKLFVRQYLEERNRTVMLLVDRSPSTYTGSTATIKADCMAQIASVLALVADYGKDGVGLLTYADQGLTIPPARGRGHVHHVMKQLLQDTSPHHRPPASIVMYEALQRVTHHVAKKSIIFILSDFLDMTEESPSWQLLTVLARRHDCIAIRCLDTLERQLPAIGVITMRDAELGSQGVVALDSGSVHHINTLLAERLRTQDQLFTRSGIEVLDITPGRPYMGDLIRFFRRRMMY